MSSRDEARAGEPGRDAGRAADERARAASARDEGAARRGAAREIDIMPNAVRRAK
jgi:hypothetical protein